MKLVIFGLTVTSSWGNGHATLWRGLCRALADQGHDVVFFERDVPYYARHRDLDRLPGGGMLHLFDEFEAAACGTPIVTDDREGLDAFPEPGSEILVAHGTNDAVEALELPAGELAAIARRARERVLDEHTAAHRARDLISALDDAASPVRSRAATRAPALVET